MPCPQYRVNAETEKHYLHTKTTPTVPVLSVKMQNDLNLGVAVGI